jgi:hypothetical protein
MTSRQSGIRALLLVAAALLASACNGKRKVCWVTNQAYGLGTSPLPAETTNGLAQDNTAWCSEYLSSPEDWSRARWTAECEASFKTYILNGVCRDTEVPAFCQRACPGDPTACRATAPTGGVTGGGATVYRRCAVANLPRFVSAAPYCTGHTVAGGTALAVPAAGLLPQCGQ